MGTSQLLIPSNFGKLITLQPSDPSVGTNYSFDVPVNTIILPVSLSFTLVTNATAITRTVLLATFDGGTNIFITPSTFLHTANITRVYTCQAGGLLLETNSNYTYQIINMSTLQYLRFGDAFKTVVDQLQAGDQISDVRFRYMQWIQE